MKHNQTRYIKQYAEGVIDYSSQYGAENPRSFSYSINNIIGEPQIFPKYGDFTQAAVMRTYGNWWDENLPSNVKADPRPGANPFKSEDYIDIVFNEPVFPWSIAIYETYNPGAVVRILALCQKFPDQKIPPEKRESTGVDPDIHGKAIPLPLMSGYTHWEILWDCPEPTMNLAGEARMFAPILREIKHRTRIIRLEFCHRHLEYYTELDAVELTGTLNFEGSSSVDPPLTFSDLTITPSPSLEDLRLSESKCDYAPRSSTPETPPSSQIEDKLDFSEFPNGNFDLLPAEILNKIFSLLPFPDFCRVAAVCRLFRSHSYDPTQFATLDLHKYWHRTTDNTLRSISARCRDFKGCVQFLNLRWSGGGNVVSPHALDKFFRTCDFSSLSYLNLASSPCVSDAILATLVEFAANVSCLDVRSCDNLSGEGIRVLHKMENLKSLSLYRTKADDAGVICIIHSNKQLQHLNIGSCQSIENYDRIAVELSEHCPTLLSLDVWRAKTLTSYGLDALSSKCSYLEELDLGWCGSLQSNTGCFISMAKRLPNLTKLFVTANRTVSDAELFHLADHCPKLRQLDVLGTRLVTRFSVEKLLSRCYDLEFIDLSFCFSFTAELIENLKLRYPDVAFKRSFQD